MYLGSAFGCCFILNRFPGLFDCLLLSCANAVCDFIYPKNKKACGWLLGIHTVRLCALGRADMVCIYVEIMPVSINVYLHQLLIKYNIIYMYLNVVRIMNCVGAS